MPHELPVFQLPTAISALGGDAETGAEAVVTGSIDAPEGALVHDTSTYWWRPELARELAAGWGITGLEFLAETVALLTPQQATAAARAAEELVTRLSARPLSQLTRSFGPELDALRAADRVSILAAARPVWRGTPDDPDVPSFVGFLLAVAGVARQTARSNLQLLYYRPQP